MDHAVFPRWEAARGPRAVSRPHSSSSGGPSISLEAGAELWGSWCCSAQAELPFIADETRGALCSPGRGVPSAWSPGQTLRAAPLRVELLCAHCGSAPGGAPPLGGVWGGWTASSLQERLQDDPVWGRPAPSLCPWGPCPPTHRGLLGWMSSQGPPGAGHSLQIVKNLMTVAAEHWTRPRGPGCEWPSSPSRF